MNRLSFLKNYIIKHPFKYKKKTFIDCIMEKEQWIVRVDVQEARNEEVSEKTMSSHKDDVWLSRQYN